MKQILFLLAAVLLLGGLCGREEDRRSLGYFQYPLRQSAGQFEQLAISERPCVPVY